jgi:hypothetical protein
MTMFTFDDVDIRACRRLAAPMGWTVDRYDGGVLICSGDGGQLFDDPPWVVLGYVARALAARGLLRECAR